MRLTTIIQASAGLQDNDIVGKGLLTIGEGGNGEVERGQLGELFELIDGLFLLFIQVYVPSESRITEGLVGNT